MSLARFAQQSGATGIPEPADPTWSQWRRDQVTALVRRASLDCLAINPRLTMSAATIGWGDGPEDDAGWPATTAYRHVFQDWYGWLQEGIIDLAIPMNYDDDAIPRQRAWYDRWVSWEKTHQAQRRIATGVGLFLNGPGTGLEQIRRALEPVPNGAALHGVALYSYAVTNVPSAGSDAPAVPNTDVLSALVADSVFGPAPFATPAVAPRLPWKDDPVGHLRGTITVAGAPADGALVRLKGPSTALLRADGNGYFGAIGLLPGFYVAEVDASGSAPAAGGVEVRQRRVATLDIVID